MNNIFRNFFVIILSCALTSGCGKEEKNPQEKNVEISSAQLMKSLRFDLLVNYKVEALRLREDFTVIGDKAPTNPDYCLKLGHLYGRAAALGSQVKELLKYIPMKEEQQLKISTPANEIMVVISRPKKCDDSQLDSFGKNVNKLEEALNSVHVPVD